MKPVVNFGQMLSVLHHIGVDEDIRNATMDAAWSCHHKMGNIPVVGPHLVVAGVTAALVHAVDAHRFKRTLETSCQTHPADTSI